VLGTVRAAKPGVSRQRHPAGGDGASLRRASLDVRVGALHGTDRGADRYEDVRGIGAAQGAAKEVRFHSGSHRCRCEVTGGTGGVSEACDVTSGDRTWKLTTRTREILCRLCRATASPSGWTTSVAV